ncbi:MAG: hypothetical protein WC517_02170 [Patescibacteria group bacterium]
MAKDLPERLLEKVRKAITDFDLDDDEINDTIAENIDLPAIISELMDEDETVKAAIKDRVRKNLLGFIEDWDPTEEINNFDLHDYLPKNFVPNLIKAVLRDDTPDDDNSLLAKVRSAVKEQIENDLEAEDIIDDLDEFRALLNSEKIIKAILDEPDTQATVRAKINEAITESIGNLSTDDLPENFWQLLGIEEKIKAMAETQEFEKILIATVKDAIENGFEFDDLEPIKKAMADNPRIKAAIDDIFEELLRDRKFTDVIKVNLQESLGRQSGHLANALIDKLGETLVERLFPAR